MLDIHSHILPEVDDGAQSKAQALEMLAAARMAGVDALVATPHVPRGHWELQHIWAAFDWLAPYASATGIVLTQGYEVSCRVLLDLGRQELRRLCINGTGMLLMELDRDSLFPQWEYILSGLVNEGVEPVIAHPERYVYIQQHPEWAALMRRYGCKIQLDAGSFLRAPLSGQRCTAGKLLRRGSFDFVASDAHRPEDYHTFRKVMDKLKGRCPVEGLNTGPSFSIYESSFP